MRISERIINRFIIAFFVVFFIAIVFYGYTSNAKKVYAYGTPISCTDYNSLLGQMSKAGNTPSGENIGDVEINALNNSVVQCNLNNTVVINVSNVSYTDVGSSSGRGILPSYTYTFYTPTSNIVQSNTTAPQYTATSGCSNSGSVQSSCVSCLDQNFAPGASPGQYIYTDFGCINTSVYGVINFTYKIVMALAFMIAFAVLIFSGYLIMISGGDPERLNRGKSLMTKAITGLLLIVFAYVILTVIGNIFNIPALQ
jgi:hypothetical protein